MEQGKLIWITGLAGSGKTTIAEQVYQKIRVKNINIVHLDGDILRNILGNKYGHSINERKELARIYAKLCSELTKQGINIIISTISLFHEVHDYNRKINKYYYEILIEVDNDTLIRRNKKDLYLGKEKNVVGIHQQPEFPKTPDIILNNINGKYLKKNVNKILKLCKLG